MTPGLGTRVAGKLLRVMGSADAIFNAPLTERRSHRLPAAVGQMIDSRQTINAAKQLVQAQAAGIRLLTWDEPRYPHAFARFTTLLYVIGNI